jgi:hypothetical protein
MLASPKLFGIDLELAVKKNAGGNVPLIITKAIAYLSDRTFTFVFN